MNRYEVSLEAGVEIVVEADSKEDAKQMVLESPQAGEELMAAAWVSDVDELNDAQQKADE